MPRCGGRNLPPLAAEGVAFGAVTTRAALAVLIFSCGGCTSGELEPGRYECRGSSSAPATFDAGCASPMSTARNPGAAASTRAARRCRHRGSRWGLRFGWRGRLGYTDGTVFSLPSRVQIGPKVPTQQQRVVDFVAACGQAFALAPEGLFRLTSTAGANIGTWAPVAIGTLAANGFEGGRVHAIGSDLHLFTAFGESVRLPIGPCP